MHLGDRRRSPRTTGLALVLATVAAAVAACGGGGGSTKTSTHAPASASPSSAAPSTAATAAATTGTGHVQACDLITKPEAETLLGGAAEGPITSKQNTPVGTVTGCVYRIVKAGSISYVNTIILATQGGSSLYQSQVLAKDKDFVQVAGIADRADFDPTSGLLAVLKGQTIFSVQVVKANHPQGKDVLIPLARRASDRLR
jgi:hypothetical protein